MKIQKQIDKLYAINNGGETASPLSGKFDTSTGGAIKISHNVGQNNVGICMPTLLYYGADTLKELISLLEATREYLLATTATEE